MPEENKRTKRGNCYTVVPEGRPTYIYGAYPYTDQGKEDAETRIEELKESEGGEFKIKIK